MNRHFAALILIAQLLFSFSSPAQNTTAKVREFRQKNEANIITEYLEFVAIPNVSRDTPNILRNAAFIQAMMKKRGINAEFLDGITPNVTPAVYGMVKVPGAK